MTKAWTDTLDQQLLDLRQPPAGKRPMTWRVVTLRLGFGKSACQRRLEQLTAAADRPARAAVVRETSACVRDGLDWLRMKKRIKAGQMDAGMAFRKRFRAADAEGGALKSSLNVVEGGGSRVGGYEPGALAAATDAKAWLFRVRHVLLKGQPDMITVLDAVCGHGQTLTALAGGNDRRALELEAVLKVALDLIAAYLAEDG